MKLVGIICAILLIGLGGTGCGPQGERHAAALAPTESVSNLRAIQSRRFDTVNTRLLMQASIGVLQDMGYTVTESREEFGVVVGSKATPIPVRVQIVIRRVPDQASSIARATFQFPTPPQVANFMPETRTDALLYREFFDKLSQSVFLTAHDI
ncbi:MAG: hypothetical protein INF64_03230 [Roseomonas sp.]|nr:hypothetical protein [Roseomonas sp.]